LDSGLPYDDVLALRDRMWELSPSLVRYDTLEHTSPDIALAGLKALIARPVPAKVGGDPLRNPIANFYQTDPISRACVHPTPDATSQTNLYVMGLLRSVTMAQCTRAFVKGEQIGFDESSKSSQAAYA
jgi:NADH dehydrogenase (ubiquinone) Fe-S protein 1